MIAHSGLFLSLMLAPNIALAVIAVIMVVASIRLVTVRNVVHAALYLMLVLAGTAAIFILLGAEFIGWTQVLVYIGAIIVLFLFGVMLTKAQLGSSEDLNNKAPQRILAVVSGVLLFVLLCFVFLNVFGASEIALEGVHALRPTTAEHLGNELFANWVLPFEAISLVLLAALIGAVVLARRDDPEHVAARSIANET